MANRIAKHPKAKQFLVKLGGDALKPSRVNNKWRKPKISKRVANVLRKEAIKTNTYGNGHNDVWNPVWDKRRTNSISAIPSGHSCDNKLGERLQKVDDGLAQQKELLKKHRKAEADRKPKSFLEKLLGE
jgi:hypothetical protein